MSGHAASTWKRLVEPTCCRARNRAAAATPAAPAAPTDAEEEPCCSTSHNVARGPTAPGRHAHANGTSLAPFTPPADRVGLRDAQGRLMLKNLSRAELTAWCASLGEAEPPKRALQVWRWLYADEGLVGGLGETVGRQNGLSQRFVDAVSGEVTADGGLELQSVVHARDGTRKLLFRLTCGDAAGGSVEAVLIPVVREQGQRSRITLCVSSQVGCQMNCQFCLTGRMGLLGNLSAAQIVEQVVQARRFLQREGDDTPLTNLVFMGMGEPLHNMESVLAAIDIMGCPLGLHISHNKTTVSTVGLVPEMRAFMERCGSARLALSLHATTDEVRDWIVPVNRRHDLASVRAALLDLFPLGEGLGRRGRKLLVEYTMLRGVNDTPEDAHRLLALLAGVACKVNLICFNPHAGTPFQRSTEEDVLAFRSILIQAGRVCTIRDSRGDDEMAACGQLGSVGLPVYRPSPMLEPPPRFRDMLARQREGAGQGQVLVPQ